MQNEYPLAFDIRIDWCEIDSLGHVNNLAIMRYVQSTRVHALESIGLMQLHTGTGIGPILASASCQFKRQLYYPGNITVRARIDHIKTTSFQIGYLVLNESREIAAEARDVIVVFDFNSNAKCPIPAAVRAQILALDAANAALSTGGE